MKRDSYSQAHVLCETANMTVEEWRQHRRLGIGGSDIGTICGLNPYESPFALWLEKTGQVAPKVVDSEAALWGTLHEENIAQQFAKRSGLRVHRRNAILQHPEYPWALANLDRYCLNDAGERGILECKTTGFAHKDDWEGDTIPEAYLCQVQWYLFVTGLQYGYVACLIGGNKLVWKLVPRDEELIDSLWQRGVDFWRQVETMTPPEIDGHPATGDALNDLYPASVAEPIDLDADTLRLIGHYEQAKEQVKVAESEQAEWENKLKALLGPHEAGSAGERPVTWKTVTTERIDSKKLKEERPELYSEYTRPGSYRRFAVK